MSTGRIVIAGGSGFLGQNLARHLSHIGYDVMVLARRPPGTAASGYYEQWDGRTPGAWARHLDGAHGLVNLAGRTVDCVKTPDHCDEILRSRVEATAVLGIALQQVTTQPRVWVQMSTAHRYGDPPDVVCDEDAAFGYGLAPAVGEAWEETFHRAAQPAMRKVILRTSFVLGRRGGALPRLVTLARFGLGGTVGDGRQGISWIHEHDMNRLFERALSEKRMSGAYIATAPHPVSNAEFMRELRSALRVPLGLRARSWMVRAAAPLLRTDAELALYGRYCVSRRLREENFEFLFPDLRSALRNLYRRQRPPAV
jgi:uncharacterized protein (TIGR01777 family)